MYTWKREAEASRHAHLKQWMIAAIAQRQAATFTVTRTSTRYGGFFISRPSGSGAPRPIGLRSWPPSERCRAAVHVLAPAYLPRYVPLPVVPRLFWVPRHPSGRVVDRDPPNQRPQRGAAGIASGVQGLRSARSGFGRR